MIGKISILQSTYGFIKYKGEKGNKQNIFFHRSDVSGLSFRDLSIGMSVTFDIGKHDKKPKAIKITKHNCLSYQNINFGYSNAEDESARDPNLLLYGYFDLTDLSKEVCFGHKFLILGRKGTGKTALCEHLRLVAENRHDLFVRNVYLSDFPFVSFSKIIDNDEISQAKYPRAWSWLLLVFLVELFISDNDGYFKEDKNRKEIKDVLMKLGFLPAREIKTLITTSTKKSFKLMLPKIAEGNIEFHQNAKYQTIDSLLLWLKEHCLNFKSKSRHILSVDGLDDILSQEKIQYDSLSSLIMEVAKLNREFLVNKISAKIILLCRTDLFEKLPGSNKNKIRQDSSITLNWYSAPAFSDNSSLFDLANMRAKLSDDQISDLFDIYFPEKFRKRPIRRFLLDNTRHNPRDFLQLLQYLKKNLPSDTIHEEQISDGLVSYSDNYFLPEIKDEMSGYLLPKEIELIFKILGALRSRIFSLSDFEETANTLSSNDKSLNSIRILELLYECSAIGNITYPEKNDKSVCYMSFKFRNQNSTFNHNEDIIFHYGLWGALNIQYEMFSRKNNPRNECLANE